MDEETDNISDNELQPLNAEVMTSDSLNPDVLNDAFMIVSQNIEDIGDKSVLVSQFLDNSDASIVSATQILDRMKDVFKSVLQNINDYDASVVSQCLHELDDLRVLSVSVSQSVDAIKNNHLSISRIIGNIKDTSETISEILAIKSASASVPQTLYDTETASLSVSQILTDIDNASKKALTAEFYVDAINLTMSGLHYIHNLPKTFTTDKAEFVIRQFHLLQKLVKAINLVSDVEYKLLGFTISADKNFLLYVIARYMRHLLYSSYASYVHDSEPWQIRSSLVEGLQKYGINEYDMEWGLSLAILEVEVQSMFNFYCLTEMENIERTDIMIHILLTWREYYALLCKYIPAVYLDTNANSEIRTFVNLTYRIVCILLPNDIKKKVGDTFLQVCTDAGTDLTLFCDISEIIESVLTSEISKGKEMFSNGGLFWLYVGYTEKLERSLAHNRLWTLRIWKNIDVALDFLCRVSPNLNVVDMRPWWLDRQSSEQFKPQQLETSDDSEIELEQTPPKLKLLCGCALKSVSVTSKYPPDPDKDVVPIYECTINMTNRVDRIIPNADFMRFFRIIRYENRIEDFKDYYYYCVTKDKRMMAPDLEKKFSSTVDGTTGIKRDSFYHAHIYIYNELDDSWLVEKEIVCVKGKVNVEKIKEGAFRDIFDLQRADGGEIYIGKHYRELHKHYIENYLAEVRSQMLAKYYVLQFNFNS